jgi:predicted transcriptional regulator
MFEQNKIILRLEAHVVDSPSLSIVSTSKRDSITILADILRSLTDSKKARKMSIVYKANLNFIRIGKYLNVLIATGMIETITEKETLLYRITERGRDFLLTYEKLKESLKMPEITGQANVILA